MDKTKTEYETYEYLPTTYVNDNEEGASQLLVVQEDGTFLCFDRPVQYVTDVEEVKGVLEGVQGCDVYDVTPQQLYLDGNNSSELISVPDQFVLPDGEESEKKYLIHDDNDSKEIPMEQDEGDMCKEVTANEETVIDYTDVESAADKNTDDCTEITLNDEQYQLLEQKGWILLESIDKTFLLDSSGLHDITADEKLINKLKSELQEDLKDESRSINIKDEYVQNRSFEIKSENTEPEVENVVGHDMVNYVIEDPGIIEEQESKVEHVSGTLETFTEEAMKEEYSGQADIITPIKAEHDYVKVTSVKDSYVKKQNDTIKIKTKFSFKDIPPEVVLGKFNGKRLIARVVKSVRPVRKLGTSVPNAQIPRINQTGFAGLDDSKFENLIREAVRGAVVYGVKDVTAAEIVVGQLSRVPAFRAAVMERGLIITKVIVQEHETGELYSESSPSLVTGRAVRERDNFNNCRFKFIPEMLRKLAYTEEYHNEDGESDHYDFLHIHIRETKSTDGIIRISITLNKRHIPLNLLTDDDNAEHPNTIYACSKCASVYNTLEGLRIHEETECMATNTKKTSIEGEAKKTYRVINASRGKQYACNLCNIAYTKLVNCQEHIKRHFKEDSVSDGGISSQKIVVTSVENKKRTLKLADVQKGLYRCNMCNHAFLDASSLSRHIITRHIQQVIDVN